MVADFLIMLRVALLASTGSVTADRIRSIAPAFTRSTTPAQLIRDFPRLLAQVIVDALRLARRILAQPALARYQPQEMLPGPATGNDDAALLKAAAEIALTIFHPVGTARMGREIDAMAVLDARLRVIGVDGLRVIDASAMPDIPSGNTAAASMMIAEKGAAMLLADQAA